MQPYFIPYIGYWQLISQIDTLVIYDDIKYIKQTWINRNILRTRDGKEFTVTLPLDHASDSALINQRTISESFAPDKVLKFLAMNYGKTINFKNGYNLLEEIVKYDNQNLFRFVFKSIKELLNYLNIDVKIVLSSSYPKHKEFFKENKVLWFCQNLNADEYLNLPGGINLYSKENFNSAGIDLQFIKNFSGPFSNSNNLGGVFSIIHEICLAEKDNLRKKLNNFTLYN